MPTGKTAARRFILAAALCLGGCGRTLVFFDGAASSGTTGGSSSTTGGAGTTHSQSSTSGTSGVTGTTTTGGATTRTTSGSTTGGSTTGCIPTVYQTIYANSSSELYTIDPTTWTPIDVGPFDADDSMTDLAVTPSNQLYAISADALYKVDPSTGAASFVMELTGGGLYNGLTFLPDNRLLAVDGSGDVVVIDPITQTLLFVGTYGVEYGSSGDLVAVADGTLYGISPGDPFDPSNVNDYLVQVDPATGVATGIGSVGFENVWGLGYYGGNVIGFTAEGGVLRIDPTTGAGTLLSVTTPAYWGAGVSPLVAAGCP
jgi:hypothetical protein